jgi:uncharacterized membrane protein YhhN
LRARRPPCQHAGGDGDLELNAVMTGLIVAAVGAAAGDWVAVARRSVRAEYVLKPLALVLLIGAAVSARTGAPQTRWAFTVGALALSLAGDVFLMVPKDLFVAGLASFLLAHAAYVAAFNTSAPPAGLTILAVVGVGAVTSPLYVRIRAGAVRSGHRELSIPLAAYVLAIGAMTVSAIATAGRTDWDAAHSASAIAGATLFLASDATIGWARFVGDLRGGPLAIIVAYHLAQVALVLALLG